MLNRTMYGTKDAAQCFDMYCERTVQQLNYRVGVFNPCLYRHAGNDISEFRHGDDFWCLRRELRLLNSRKSRANTELTC